MNETESYPARAELLAQAELDALTARLESLADPEQKAFPSFADTDWRSLAWKCASTIRALRAQADAADEPEPVAWMFQHEETGRTTFEYAPDDADAFEKNNPRWFRVCAVYRTHPDDRARELLKEMIDSDSPEAFDRAVAFLKESGS